MSLHDTDALYIETATATESLPDPTTVPFRTHHLVNTGSVIATWSAPAPALPFTENAVNVATITVGVGQTKDLYSDGVRWQVAPSSSGFLFAPTPTKPVRTLNTDFIPNATRPTLCTYSVQIECTSTLSLLSADDGKIELRSDLGAPVTVRSQCRNRVVQTLGLLVGTRFLVESELSFLVPAGWSVRIATVTLIAAPTYALTQVSEVTL